jgi:hypothetical protein
MNAPVSEKQGTTPPKSPRTVRELFLDYLRKSRKYYDEANAIQAEFLRDAIRYGSERAAYIACAQDIRWQEAVENQKFMERLANMYGQAALLQELEYNRATLLRIEKLLEEKIT